MKSVKKKPIHRATAVLLSGLMALATMAPPAGAASHREQRDHAADRNQAGGDTDQNPRVPIGEDDPMLTGRHLDRHLVDRRSSYRYGRAIDCGPPVAVERHRGDQEGGLGRGVRDVDGRSVLVDADESGLRRVGPR